MRYYFAYASNMNPAHMAKLCPQAEALGRAHIEHYQFFVAAGGFGSIARKRGAVLHGVLWRISAKDRIALDRYEALDSGLYRATTLPVHWQGRLLRALVYIATDERQGRASKPYREMVMAGGRAWNLPEDYLVALERGMSGS